MEVQRRFFGTLHNTYAFFALYSNLDGFRFSEPAIPLAQRTESDRWILSRLHSLVQDVTAFYDDYDPTKAARAIQDFVSDDLSNWYVRLNRKRFWKGEYEADKIAAYQTLYQCLDTVARLSAPIAPFYAEQLFQDLNSVSGLSSSESVHLERFPVADTGSIDKALEERMALAQQVSSLVHSLRKKYNLKVRQPLQRIMIPVLQPELRQQLTAVEDLIKTEVNVKAVEYIDDTSGVLVKKIKPNFKELGKRFGPKLKVAAAGIQQMQQSDIQLLERNGLYNLLVDNEEFVLTPQDVEISSEDIPGWHVASEGALTVALDVNLTEELKQEGLARELVNRIQNLRKDQGMEVQDRIRVQLESESDLLQQAVTGFGEYIAMETQAEQLEIADDVQDGTTLDLDGHEVTVHIEVV